MPASCFANILLWSDCSDFHEGSGRCEVCKQLRKGRCGTASAPKRCLRRPPERDADSPTAAAAEGLHTAGKVRQPPSPVSAAVSRRFLFAFESSFGLRTLLLIIKARDLSAGSTWARSAVSLVPFPYRNGAA